MESALLTEQPISDAKCIPNLLALTIPQLAIGCFQLRGGHRRHPGVVTLRNQHWMAPLASPNACQIMYHPDTGSGGQAVHPVPPVLAVRVQPCLSYISIPI